MKIAHCRLCREYPSVHNFIPHHAAYEPIARQSSWKCCEIIESKARSSMIMALKIIFRLSDECVFGGGTNFRSWNPMAGAKLLQRKCFLQSFPCWTLLYVLGGKCVRRHVQIEQWHGTPRVTSQARENREKQRQRHEKKKTYGSVAKLHIVHVSGLFRFEFVYNRLQVRVQIAKSSIMLLLPPVFYAI